MRVVITGAAGKIGRAEDGQGSFRLRYLLPMAVEVQFYAAYARDEPRPPMRRLVTVLMDLPPTDPSHRSRATG